MVHAPPIAAEPVHAAGTILVLGAYGGFGARLSRRRVAAGHHVLVAGRHLDRASAFCAREKGFAHGLQRASFLALRVRDSGIRPED
ncbi:hypothetical protein [Sphingomonas sp. So64.6b]|uniref:hypothetical protein n=1 Tax=Sphingomonas sp. So64.6b TaxID=2997354 RepID=UPI001921C2E5|nr:hypothetical protein [Sphingomonas sp. So64.6b]